MALYIMNDLPLLIDTQIERLLSQQPISDKQPWAAGDLETVDGYLKGVCAEVSRITGAVSRIEWNHYGSGYASYVDAWFYMPTPDFNVQNPIRYGEQYVGLVVLLSRLSPYFVFMEGEKHWHAHGASSYLPEFEMLDKVLNESVRRLADKVQPILENHGLCRACRPDLSAPLPSDAKVSTNLADRGFTQFDALFYWED